MDLPTTPVDGLEDVLNTGHIPDESCPAHVRSTGLPLATLNLVLAVLGAGQLTMPYALSQLGTTLGLGSATAKPRKGTVRALKIRWRSWGLGIGGWF
eukprot:Skav206278  [mRNA]  locus=scaffold922:57850:58435:- [translate_table: standard]